MRELKFRAWHNGIMIENVHPISQTTGGFLFLGGGYNTQEVIGEKIYVETELIQSPNGVVMQSTGIKDKNGVEIYEGDVFNCIYKSDGCKCRKIVTWQDEEARFALRRTGQCQQKFVVQKLWDVARYEIIGNIYSNPELLNPEQL